MGIGCFGADDIRFFFAFFLDLFGRAGIGLERWSGVGRSRTKTASPDAMRSWNTGRKEILFAARCARFS
jgi:hypothetical protein